MLDTLGRKIPSTKTYSAITKCAKDRFKLSYNLAFLCHSCDNSIHYYLLAARARSIEFILMWLTCQVSLFVVGVNF